MYEHTWACIQPSKILEEHLNERISSSGIEIKLNSEVQEINESEDISDVIIKDNDTIAPNIPSILGIYLLYSPSPNRLTNIEKAVP